jgi:hypothetical protein
MIELLRLVITYVRDGRTSSGGLWRALADEQPEAASAMSSVSVTS